MPIYQPTDLFNPNWLVLKPTMLLKRSLTLENTGF
nr:MAG TPA: hypothetical protein [Caudoviricetes sp.]